VSVRVIPILHPFALPPSPGQEFVRQSRRLVSDGLLREGLVREAKRYVDQQHSVEHERHTYRALVQTLEPA